MIDPVVPNNTRSTNAIKSKAKFTVARFVGMFLFLLGRSEESPGEQIQVRRPRHLDIIRHQGLWVKGTCRSSIHVASVLKYLLSGVDAKSAAVNHPGLRRNHRQDAKYKDLPVAANCRTSFQDKQLGNEGITQPLMLSETAISAEGGAESDARDAPTPTQDADLTQIMAAWPGFPDHIKSEGTAAARPRSPAECPR